jgi:hypothetical protein
MQQLVDGVEELKKDGRTFFCELRLIHTVATAIYRTIERVARRNREWRGKRSGLLKYSKCFGGSVKVKMQVMCDN